MQTALPLLIFDLDGVLVDSEPISERLFLECLREDGFSVDEAFNSQHFLGRSMRDCLATLQTHFGRLPDAAVLSGFNKRIEDALRSELEPIAFVEEALRVMPHPKCVASGSELRRIEVSLQATGLSHFFLNVTSSYEVQRGKPAPDVFLKAAEKNNYPPRRCLVVEDTVFGVAAGCAAGMKVLCYQPTNGLAYEVPPGVVVFTSMQELPAAVERCSLSL